MVHGSLVYGADPELFFKKDGVVMGAEKIIPNEGLHGRTIVLDGVQIELHPGTVWKAGEMAFRIKTAFTQISQHLVNTGVKLSFDPLVEVSKEELLSLSLESRMLGCEPSRNFYGLKQKEVDGMKYRKRSAGGHIHVGLYTPIYNAEVMGVDERERLVPIFDVLLGNTCVMIDRGAEQIERRKLYGRVGEYRLPDYGLEYRTLSNFWLKHPALTTFVFEMTRMVVGVLNTTLSTMQNIEQELFDLVDLKNVIVAIQKNDPNLAWENWKLIRPFIVKHFDESSPIPPSMIGKFENFLQKGSDYWFPGDPLKSWSGSVSETVWSDFLRGVKS